MAQAAGRVREIDLDLAPAALEDVTMTVRLAGDKLGVVIRAASGATATAIEGARDAIAERLAAIGQPLTSLIIQQTGANDATGTAGQSRDGEAPQGWGDFGNQRSARRDPSRS
jgi:Flagellar hook-length control protein FliK